MAFNFFKRKNPEVLEVVEPAKPDNRIDADLLLMQIQLMHENHYSVAKHKSGKGEPRGYCRAQSTQQDCSPTSIKRLAYRGRLAE